MYDNTIRGRQRPLWKQVKRVSMSIICDLVLLLHGRVCAGVWLCVGLCLCVVCVWVCVWGCVCVGVCLLF